MAPTSEQQEELEKSLKDLNLTNEELNKFEKAFKDPEFLKLFEEYAKEVSDPKVKAETDQYLRQLEQQGRGEEVYGKGVQLITPTPGMVLKTKVMESAPKGKASEPAGKAGSGILTVGQKVFINVCTSDKVDKYSLKDAKDAEGRSGKQLSIPLTLGPMRVGADKQGKPVAVYDFVVHPGSLEFAATQTAAFATLAETAIEQVEKVTNTRLSRSYRRLNVKYKATEGCAEPPVQAFRTAEGGESVGGRLRPRADVAGVDVPGAKAVPEAAAAPSTPGAAAAAGNGGGAGGRSNFSFVRSKAAPQDGGQRAQGSKEPSQAGYRHADGSVTPEWTLVHRGEADLAAAWGDAGRGLALNTSIPRELVVRVTMPDVASAAAVDLDVGQRRLALKVPGRYQLDLPLPYAVDETKGKAKLDKTRKQLEIILPVVLPPPPPRPAAVAAAGPSDPPPPSPPTGGSTTATGQEEKVTAAETGPANCQANGSNLVRQSVPTSGETCGATSGACSEGAAAAGGATAVEVHPSCTERTATWAEARSDAADAAIEETRAAETSAAEPQPQSQPQPQPQPQPQRQRKLTENERKWQEIHAAQGAESEGAAVAVAAEGTAGGAAAAAAAAEAASEAGSAAGGKGGAARDAELKPEAATVLLRPRLRHDVALELD